MSYDIVLYQAQPISTQVIASAWKSIGRVDCYDDYVAVEAKRGNLFVHLNNLIDRPDCLSDVDDLELRIIRAITEPTYNFNIQSMVPELLNEGFLKFPASADVAVDNDNGFIGSLAEALHLARAGTDWVRRVE